MNISLPDQMKVWAEAQAAGGQFANVSDYMRDLIRRDQLRREGIAQMQNAIDAGLASGPAKAFDMDEFITAQKAK
ncbi:MAG: type II toxin-antitoxin system ParD family antitoxin [Cypionkella sp.]